MIRIENVDAFELLRSLPDQSIDVTITDPPYNAAARNARSVYDGKASASSLGRSALGIMGSGIAWHLDDATIVDLTFELLRVTRRWVVICCALEHLGKFHDAAGGFRTAKVGGAYVRSCTWDRNNTGTPQLTGDRPAQGAEGLAILHAPGGERMRWNAKGKRGIYRYTVCREKDRHPAEKPIALIEELLSDFTDPGELILDPFCGRGTVAAACKMHGRAFLGCDNGKRDTDDRPWAELAQERIDSL